MPSGIRINQLGNLPSPPVGGDRVLVGRDGVSYRRDLSQVRGGLSLRSLATKPTPSDFPTSINQGTATLIDIGDALSLEQDASITNDQFRLRLRALPAGDWDVQIGAQRLWGAWRYQTGGLALRESSSGRLEAFAFGYGENDAGLVAARYSSPTAFAGERRFSWEFHEVGWFRARKYNGQFQWLFSPDGLSWHQFLNPLSLNDHFSVAPDQWGFFINPINVDTPAHSQCLDVFHWRETADTDLYPFSAYANRYGRGDRRAQISVTTNAVLAGGSDAIDRLVDGGVSLCWWNAGQSDRHVTFQFPEPCVITEAKWFQNQAASHGAWEWQTSTDGFVWNTISDEFVLDATNIGAEMGDLANNAASSAFYRMQQVSGLTNSAPYLREIEFKIGRS